MPVVSGFCKGNIFFCLCLFFLSARCFLFLLRMLYQISHGEQNGARAATKKLTGRVFFLLCARLEDLPDSFTCFWLFGGNTNF